MTTEGRIPWCRSLLARLARFIWRTLRAEWHSIVVDPIHRLMRRGLSGLLLGFVAAFGVVFFHDIAQHPLGAKWVEWLGGVRADLPLWLSLLRTPVSLYVPALDLPVWAGITQLFLAFALAEVVLGRARTLAIAYATTVAGTLTARVMIALGPGWWGFGLPHQYGKVLDTGPSAAVVGLFTYLAVVKRAPVVFTLTGGSMVWESIAVPNLAGREHLIAVGSAILLGLLHGRRARFQARLRILLRIRERGLAPTQPPLLPAPAPGGLSVSPAAASEGLSVKPSAAPEGPSVRPAPAPAPGGLSVSPVPAHERLSVRPASAPEGASVSPAPAPEGLPIFPAPAPEEPSVSPATAPERPSVSPAAASQEPPAPSPSVVLRRPPSVPRARR
ncbi:hypothetical protein ACWDBD_33175 [Streptomyces sp. NPDC001118]